MSTFPYTGLRPFERHESDIFWGRKEHTNQLMGRLAETHFIAVVGPSGCGKSSLVRTGLLAKLDVNSAEMPPWQWRIVEMRPGDHPFRELATHLLEEKALDISSFPSTEEAKSLLQAMLRRGPLSFHEILESHPLPENTALLVVIDQFEELFRPFKAKDLKWSDSRDEAIAFVKLLITGSQHPLVYVIITMRSDFIGDSAIFYGLPEAINQGIFVVPRLSRKELQQAIEQPAKRFGGKIELVLVNHLLNEMGNDPDQLPILQHALMQMWTLAREEAVKSDSGENTTILVSKQHYKQIGELDHALSKHADAIFDSLSRSQQAIAETCFRLLCDYQPDRRDTRRPVKLSEIAEVANVTWQEVAEVIEEFRQPGRNFLLSFPEKTLEPDTTVEIIHESFIRGWDKLKKWAEEEYKFAEEYRRLEERARSWQQGTETLLREAALNRFIEWRDCTGEWRDCPKPTSAWAKRYGKNFELTIKFLEDSRIAQERELQQLEEKRQRELKQEEENRQRELSQAKADRKRARQQVAGAAFIIVILIIITSWAVSERNRANQTALNLFNSQLSHAKDAIHQEDYQTAFNILKDREGLSAIPPARHQIRNLLAGFSQLLGGHPQQQVYQTNAPLTAIAVSPNGQFLTTAGDQGILVLLETSTGKLLSRLEGHTGTIHSVVFDPQNRWLASAGEDRKIIRWSLPTGQRLSEWPTSQEVMALAVSPDGHYLVSGGYDNNITWWDVATGQRDIRPLLTGDQDLISYLTFSPDNEWLASASYDYATLWPLKTGQTPWSLKHSAKVQNIVFTPDSKWVATSSNDKTIQLWEVESGESLSIKLTGHQNQVRGLSFLADNKYLVSASQDRTLRIWDLASKVTVRVLQGHTAGVNSLAIYGQQIFSASDDGTVQRWEASLPYQQRIQLLAGHGQPLSVAITPAGNAVVVKFSEDKWSQCEWSKGKCSPPQVDGHLQQLFRESSRASLGQTSVNPTDKAVWIPEGQPVVKITRENTVLHFWDVEKSTGEEWFSLRLPKPSGETIRDFDSRCTSQSCWVAVLFRDELMWYELKD